MSGPILVIEDDRGVSSFLQWSLEDEGYSVALAANGEEALRSVEGGRPTLILLDYGLPFLDGAGVSDQLRQRGFGDIPIVLMTADERISQKAERVSAHAALAKPLDLDHLLTVVRDLIGQP